MISNCSLAQQKWGNLIGPEIPPAAGKFRTVALEQLMRRRNLGGSRWLDQFAVGFPITGSLSRRHVYAVSDKSNVRIPRSQLFGAASARFRDLAAKSGHKDDQVWRGEPLQQAERAGCSNPSCVPLMASRCLGTLGVSTLVSASEFRRRVN